MLNVLKARIWLTLQRIAGDLRIVARVVLGPRNTDHMQGLWLHRVVLQQVRVRVRRGAGRI